MAVKVLAFDCSAETGSVAVLNARGKTIFSERFASARGRGGALFPSLERAVTLAGKPDRIAVGVGPGSYSGLRVAAAAADALSLATGASVAAICSLRALPCGAERYLAAGDARGGQYYLAEVCGRDVRGEIRLLDRATLEAELASAAPGTPVLVPRTCGIWPGEWVASPDAEVLAVLALAATPLAPDRTPEPIYLKPPHITAPNPARSVGAR